LLRLNFVANALSLLAGNKFVLEGKGVGVEGERGCTFCLAEPLFAKELLVGAMVCEVREQVVGTP
jgi:hypothetical protein